jgi:hypothetical protein
MDFLGSWVTAMREGYLGVRNWPSLQVGELAASTPVCGP